MSILISVQAGNSPDTSSVQAWGSEQRVVTDQDVRLFQLYDETLKQAVERYHGKRPNDVFLHSPTPWNDLYKSFGWQEVQAILSVKNASILGMSMNPAILAEKTFSNDSNKKATFTADVSQLVTETVQSFWSNTDQFSFNVKVSYTFKLGPGKFGVEGGIGYSHTWGKGESESWTVSIGTKDAVSVELEPGEKVEAVLTANRGTLDVRIVYQVALTGYLAANYDPTYRGHHFWALPIEDVLSAAGLPYTKEYTEDLKVTYYTNSRIEVKNASGRLRTAAALSALPGVHRG